MARCTECQTEWTFKDKAGIYKRVHATRDCPYCGAQQFVSLKSKKQGSVLNFLIIFAMFIPIFFNIPIIPHIIFALAVIAVVMYLQVVLIKLSDKEEFPI